MGHLFPMGLLQAPAPCLPGECLCTPSYYADHGLQSNPNKLPDWYPKNELKKERGGDLAYCSGLGEEKQAF